MLDLAHQVRWAKHVFSGQCDFTPMVCCSFGGHSTPQFLQCDSSMVFLESFIIIDDCPYCTSANSPSGRTRASDS